MFDDSYKTIEKHAESIFKDRGSKFLGFAIPATDEREAKEALIKIRDLHPSANHHCYAYRLFPDKSAFRSNDDGEPANSAGKPILGQIYSYDLTNTLIVVSRYFGGVLLGVPGLIQAYKTAAQEAIKSAGIVEKPICEVFHLSFKYEEMNKIMKALKDVEAKIMNQNFELSCELNFIVKRNLSNVLTNTIKDISNTHLKYIKTI